MQQEAVEVGMWLAIGQVPGRIRGKGDEAKGHCSNGGNGEVHHREGYIRLVGQSTCYVRADERAGYCAIHKEGGRSSELGQTALQGS